MRRFALAIIIVLLTFGASGASALVVDEPCTGYEQQGQDDRACPPTCITCGCCAQAAETATLRIAAAPAVTLAPAQSRAPHLPNVQPRDILHVPKLRLA